MLCCLSRSASTSASTNSREQNSELFFPRQMTRIDVFALGYGIDVTWPVLLFWPSFFLCLKKVHVDGLTMDDVLIYILVYPVQKLDVVVFCVEQKTSRPR